MSYAPHIFNPHHDNREYCAICGYVEGNPVHLVTAQQVAAEYGRRDAGALMPGLMDPTDLMPRATDDNHDTEDLQQGDFVYLDVGSVKLTIYAGCSTDALEKIHRFIGNLLAKKL